MSNSSRALSLCISAALLTACGGSDGSGSSALSSTSTSTTTQSANLAVMVSDASSEDWATIGVKIVSIALIPQDGGDNVTVYSAPSPVPTTNLVLLDQIDELLGNTSIPTGTYTGAVLTVSANPGDILLTTATNPEAGFAAPAMHDHPLKRDPDSAQARDERQPHGAGECELRFAAGREHDAEQCARPRVRSRASGVPDRPCARGRRPHRVGRQLRRPGAPPGAPRSHPPRAAAFVRRCAVDLQRLELHHRHSGNFQPSRP